ncbi:MAG: SET domain-containing protein [Lentisphaerales bacterium]|jgi:SET domain-containing protein|nr:MAG: SET domain-containing protein [Lentisphaerales bacterium]
MRRFSVRSSTIHGKGVYARQRLAKGLRLIEYKGARRPWGDCKDEKESVTYLFDVEDGLVIDPWIRGNSAKYINHSCAPNCEAVLEEGRVYIESIREIQPDDELTYDYSLTLERRPTKEDIARHACRCRSRRCRGTLLALPKPRKRRR